MVRVRLELRDAGGQAQGLDFNKTELRIGRAPGNDLLVNDPRVSSMHGRFSMGPAGLLYEDLGSTNGSALIRDGKRSAVPAGGGAVPLKPGDSLLLGDADSPTQVSLVEFIASRTPTPSAPDATVVAQRALGQMSLAPAGAALQSLLRFLGDLRQEQDRGELIQRALTYLLQSMPQAGRAECHIPDEGLRLALDARGETIECMPPSVTLQTRLRQEQKALLLEDLQGEKHRSASIRRLPSRSLLLAPLLQDQGLTGFLQVGSREQGRFREADLELLAVVADQLSAVFHSARLFQRLKEAESRLRGERDYLKSRLAAQPAMEQMLGDSPAMQELRSQIRKVAPSRTTVLIMGETGSGKELVARALHELSPRAQAAFAAVNCSSLVGGVLESELFGHLRGAFTGAHRDRKGLFEVAHEGSLFLDEVGDMPAELQPKLLRVLEEGKVLPVGANQPRTVDVRVMAATHQDLEALVQQGAFRQDLLFRLDVFTLRVPPLRERREDIVPLATAFLQSFAQEQGRNVPALSREAEAALMTYHWPGNIRELRNEMERACLLAVDERELGPGELSEKLGGGEQAPQGQLKLRGKLKEMMESLEATVLRQALQRHDGNRTRCAKELGISRQALITKIAKLGL